MVNSHLNSSFGKASNAVSGSGCSNLGPASGDMNWGVLNSTANSGPSVGASSLVTDANSALSGGPNLQRSASINTESYLRLPASPMSFSSNNISVSGSSAMDGSSIVQQSSHQDHGSQQMQQRQQGASSATSQLTPRTGQVPLPTGPQFSNSLTQEQSYLSQMHKKPRLDIKREDSLPQQVIQQLLHRQDSMQLQGHNPQLQALIQQQRLLQRQQQPQQILQSLPQIQRAQLQQQLQQQQLRHLQQQGMQPMSMMKRPYENGVCARRLMQYMFHQRHRPTDNPIIYWKKFVAEYFAPRAKKRWCLSLYDNVGQHALGVFPQAAMDAWQCDICGSKSGRGFEATYEVLPRLNKVKFDSGVIDELLFLDMPRECRLSTGIMMLEYGKAVQESVYEQLRVVREGQLRVIFSSDLKILSWEFCARRHEELFPRRLLAPQVNQLLQVAQKYQATVTESGSTGVSPQDLQSNCNLFLTAGRQLVRNLESQSLNDLGFSKRFVRCLQIAEVVNSLKDLMILSRDQNMGPIESLKNFAKQAAAAKLQMQKMQEIEQQAIAQGLTNDRTALNKVMAMHPGLNGQINNNNQLGGGGIVNSSAQTAMALSNYQNLLRQNSMNSNPTVTQQDSSCSFNSSSQAQSAPFQGPSPSIPGSMQNVQGNGFLFPNQLMQQQALSPNILLQQNHPQSSPGNQNLQQHMIQQLLQEMMSGSGGGRVQQQPQHQPSAQSLPAQSVNGTAGDEVFDAVSGNVGGLAVKPGSSPMIGNGVGYAKNTTSAVANASSGIAGGLLNRSNSFKGTSNVNSMVASTDTLNQKTNDILQNLHLPEMVQDISQEFPDWDV